MAFGMVMSAAVQGLHVEMIHVEADVSNGLPMFHMVGYLSSEVKEASERVRTAIRNTGIQIPARKVVVNLAPATMRKKGSSFDLPIALAVLAALDLIPRQALEGTAVVGELGLDGRVQKVSGVLPVAAAVKEAGIRRLILPVENMAEGALTEGIEVLGAETLEQICGYLNGKEQLFFSRKEGKQEEKERFPIDFQEIRGQELVRRAAEVAVAGGHNLLMVGPPGSGKSMIARRIPTILPPLSRGESMEITKIYSVLGLVDQEHPLKTKRPFREVHHTVSRAALIGGGMIPVPGEISLAHGGVLFLDELAEFQKPVLESLRQPLEEKRIRLSRRHGNYEFPADFMLVAAMNPCACGNYPDPERCRCLPHQIQQYLGKVSQPFLDRMDLCVEVSRVSYDSLCMKSESFQIPENSETIRERICRAREIQSSRYQGETGIGSGNGFHLTNASMGIRQLEHFCRLGKEEERLMQQAYSTLHLTARTYHKVLKVARTIADLEGSEVVREPHLMEAIGYRGLDKKYWSR